jgi:Cu-processing system ATP-binding protein
LISIDKLNKKFGNHQVLFDIDLNIEKGLITSIGGPNGSGKTTLMKCLLGLVKYENGKISIDDVDISTDKKYKEKIGYMPQIGRYPDNLSINEIFDMIIDLRGNPVNKKDELIEIFSLEPFLKSHMRTLSGGTRQKVSAVISMMFSPDILILDEPTTGLDPNSSSRLKDLIQQEKEKNKTIILISHIYSEIEDLSDRFVYILDGKIRLNDDLNNIVATSGEKNLEKAIAHLVN